MAKELAKNYNPKDGRKIYKEWMEQGYFHAEPNPDKEPFTIVIPPPNITGAAAYGTCPG